MAGQNEHFLTLQRVEPTDDHLRLPDPDAPRTEDRHAADGGMVGMRMGSTRGKLRTMVEYMLNRVPRLKPVDSNSDLRPLGGLWKVGTTGFKLDVV